MAISPKTKLRLLEALDLFKVIGIAVLLFLAIQTLRNQTLQTAALRQQVSATKAVVDQIDASNKTQAAQIHQLTQHIDCIAALFEQPNRSLLTITNLQNCQLSETGDPSTSTPAPTSNTNIKVAPNSQNGAKNTSSKTHASNTNTPGQGQNPAKVFGVPVCVPFTNLCVRSN